MSAPALYCGTRPADADDLRALATINYGHFTAMRVRHGAVQGLDLHLARLRLGHATLFDAPFDEDQLRQQLRTVLAGWDEVSVRVTGFARDFNYREPLNPVRPEWFFSIDAVTRVTSAASLTLKSFPFVRPLPHIKHLATLPLFHYRRQARRAGHDDALFVDGPGVTAQVVEGSVWNVGFWDGTRVLWPQGPALRGTCESLLQRGLDALGVPQCVAVVTLDQARALSAFTANANGCACVAAIDDSVLSEAPGLQALLARALATQPWDRI